MDSFMSTPGLKNLKKEERFFSAESADRTRGCCVEGESPYRCSTSHCLKNMLFIPLNKPNIIFLSNWWLI